MLESCWGAWRLVTGGKELQRVSSTFPANSVGVLSPAIAHVEARAIRVSGQSEVAGSM